MKKIAIVTLLITLAGAAGPARLAAAPQQVIEEVVAVVNNEIITLSDVKTQFEQYIQDLKAQNLPQADYDKQYTALRSQLLDVMIQDMLLLQKAKELNLNVAEQLKGAIETMKKQYNFSTDDELRRAIEQQGIPYEIWLKKYEEQILKQGVIYMEVDRSIVLDESEIVQYYRSHPQEFTVPTEYTLRAVYLEKSGRTPEALEALKQSALDKIKGGAAIDAVAAEMSDPPLKDLKGDLGTVKKGEIDPALEAAVDKLKAGEMTDWVEAKAGWYLIKLEGRKESYLKSFDEAKPQVQDKLTGERRQKKLEEYLTTLKARSYIKIIKPNPLDIG